MDVYALTRKQRPTRLTLGQPVRQYSTTAGPNSLDSSNTTSGGGGDSSVGSSSSRNNSLNSSASSLQDVAVTGPPSRDHWKPDSEARYCGYVGCQATFGLFERRHHCRKCGDIFCSTHCSNYFRLDQSSQFHPRGVLSRGCDLCANEYRRWQEQLKQQTENTQTRKTEEKPESDNRISRRRAGIMTQQPQAMEGVTELGRDDIVQPDESHQKGIAIKKAQQVVFNPIPSIQADWQWSTF